MAIEAHRVEQERRVEFSRGFLEDSVLEFTVYELPAPGHAGIAAAHTATTSLQPYLDQLASGTL